MTTKLTRQDAIKLLTAQNIYDQFDLELWYIEEEDRYPSVYEIMATLGVSEGEIDQQ